MFIALTHELRARGGGHSRTEVVALDAELLGIESDANEHVASVKFDGTLRIDGEIERVSEVWNLAKPANGRGGWLLAGIQQMA
jgi:predicted lipid-binding transport protein (Tim44 family)